MAAGFLITRILLVALLSEVEFFSASRVRSLAYPAAWQGVKKTQEHYGFGNRRPLWYIQALRKPHRQQQPSVHDQVQGETRQRPLGSFLKVRGHAQPQIQPRAYHQAQSPYQPWADDATKRTEEKYPSQHLQQRHQPLFRPRNFEFSLKVPFAEHLVPNKEASSTTKGSDVNSGLSDGSGQYTKLYKPSSVQIFTAFNSASGADGVSGKGSTNNLNGEKPAHDVSRPSFHFGLSVPIPPPTAALKPSSSNDGFPTNLQRPGSVGFVQDGYTEPANPQSSSTPSESELLFLNSANVVQQQAEHQIYEPVQTRHTESTVITFSPGHAEQSLVFPEPSAPSLQIPQDPPPQPDSVYSGSYSTPKNPFSNDCEKGQSGETVSDDLTNVHPSLYQSQYESVPHYSAGQVKPNNYGQHQTQQQPVDAPFQSFGQYVETPLHPPSHPSSPAGTPSQYELPPFYQVATSDYNRPDNVGQVGPTDFSSSSAYQYSRGQGVQEALPEHLTALDPTPSLQYPLSDYQTQLTPSGQDTGERYRDGKPQYTQLFIDFTDVEDETDKGDGQHNYFTAPTPYYDGYYSTQTQ